MWLFLLTEVMFFGGLFTAYLIMRNWYYPAFVEGSHQLSIFWGTANTAVLITLQLHHGHGRVVRARCAARAGWCSVLVLTFVLGLVFLGIKAHRVAREVGEAPRSRASTTAMRSFINPASDPEVYKEYHDKPLAPDMAGKTEMYFFLYFAMTGMHALHMIIGIAILGFMIVRARGRRLHHRARDLC